MVTLLMASLADDSDKAFMLDLYRDYYGLVRKKIYSITRDANHTEDLINDTFLKLIGKISLLRTLESCKRTAYVVYTGRSVAINFIKHRDVEKKHGYYGLDIDLADVAAASDTVEDWIIRWEERAEIDDVMLKLPENQKDLLYFKYFLEMENTEIAEILGIAPASVREYLTRARRNAKKLLAREMEDGHEE